MKRVLLVQPSMQPPGGGNGVAAWVLQALAGEHRDTVLSWQPVEIDPINRFFGTTLQPGEYAINPPGVWHTADVSESATGFFVTAGVGTQGRPR